MTAEVIPIRQPKPIGELESLLVGAVLELPDKLELIQASGLGGEDFQSPRASLAWRIIKRMAEQRLEITSNLVCSRGVSAGMLREEDRIWLRDLEQGNVETKETALQLADDIRGEARKRDVRNRLLAAVDLIDRGRFSPSRTVSGLQTIINELTMNFANDETADSDLMELNATWDENVAKGKSTLEPTGVRVLDELLGGGVPRNLWLVQGKPGVGKNMLLATIIKAQLLRDAGSPQPSRTGIFGLENGTSWLTRRWQAEDLGLSMRDVGSKKLSPEEAERKVRIDAMHYDLLRRVEIYRHDGAPLPELAWRARRWIFKHNVSRIYVDNLREVRPDPRARAEYWQHVAETIRVFRDIGSRHGVSVCFLVHDTDDAARPGHETAPDPDRMQGGKDPAARARLVIGLWRRGNTFRATITKNEMGGAGLLGPTMEFQANYDAGTFNAEGGRIIDLKNEAAQERRETKDRKIEESVEDSERRRALLAKRAAASAPAEPAAPPPPPPQRDLGL
jgi:replicative DNA helicase